MGGKKKTNKTTTATQETYTTNTIQNMLCIPITCVNTHAYTRLSPTYSPYTYICIFMYVCTYESRKPSYEKNKVTNTCGYVTKYFKQRCCF